MSAKGSHRKMFCGAHGLDVGRCTCVCVVLDAVRAAASYEDIQPATQLPLARWLFIVLSFFGKQTLFTIERQTSFAQVSAVSLVYVFRQVLELFTQQRRAHRLPFTPLPCPFVGVSLPAARRKVYIVVTAGASPSCRCKKCRYPIQRR